LGFSHGSPMAYNMVMAAGWLSHGYPMVILQVSSSLSSHGLLPAARFISSMPMAVPWQIWTSTRRLERVGPCGSGSPRKDPPERDRSLATWPPEIMMLWDVQIFSGAMEIKPAFQETGSEGHPNYM
jgi:hypothetical protein